jgi:hypothetical protein
VLLGLYVDDLVIAARKKKQIEEFKKDFGSRFKIKDLGELKKILGIQITRDRKNRVIHLNQTSYIRQMLHRFGMSHESHTPTRVPLGSQNLLIPARDEDERTDTRDYQERIGSVMFPMVYTRPDTAFATSKLARFMSDPTKVHARVLKGLMRYYRSTADLQIKYGPEGLSAKQVLGYSDADFAADKSDRKSVIGTVFMFAGGPISWASRKQRSVATSTTEAEYIALSTTAKQGVWIAQFLKDIGYARYISKNQHTVQIYGDNQSSLALVQNPHLHERSKHIDIAYHYVRELQENNHINVTYIPSKDMLADGLTKPLARDQFERHRKLMGLVSSGSSRK